MKLKTILILVIASIVLGVLGGFATSNLFVGIGLPIVLIVFGIMWLAIRPTIPKEEEKKEEDTTQSKDE